MGTGASKTRKSIKPKKIDTTRKTKDVSLDTLQKLTKKYGMTKGNSKKECAERLVTVKHVMSARDLKILEDFLDIPEGKRYKGPRYGVRKSGTLYCISGPCEKEDMN